MKKVKLLSYTIAGLMAAPLSTSLVAAPTNFTVDPQSIASDMMYLNAEPLKGPRQTARGDVWDRLRSGFQMSEVNPELVRKHEQYYASRAQYFSRTLARGSKYLYFITDEVERRKMPTEIALLPVIESAFVPKAKSHVGADGLWQFMPATGTDFGLEQTWWYDGRRDVYDATHAALDYLESLNKMFDGDWALALASYNWGQGNLSRAVKRARANGVAPTYENLKMPNETRNYVPKLLAVRNIIDNPRNFGLELTELPNKPYFEAIHVGKHMDVALAANFAEISLDEFYALNPAYKLPVYADKQGRKMLIPAEKVSTFNKNLRKWGNKPLMSWDVYTAQGGESIYDLATQAGMSLAEFKDMNGIYGSSISRGRPLLMAKNSTTPVAPSFSNPQVAETIMVARATTPVAPAQRVQTRVVVEIPAQKTFSQSDIIIAKNEVETKQTAPIATVEKMPVVIAKSEPVVVKPIATSETISSNPITVVAKNEPEDVLQSFVRSLPNAQEETPAAIAVQPAEAITTQVAALSDVERKTADEQVNRAINDWNKETFVIKKPSQTEVAKAETTATPKKTNSTSSKSTHKIQSGDTLYSIAREYDINVQDLRALNSLSNDNIQVGKVLQVSGKPSAPQLTAKDKKSPSAKETVYTVQKGDSWYKVAKKYGITHDELMKINTQNASSSLLPGQKIKVRLIDL